MDVEVEPGVDVEETTPALVEGLLGVLAAREPNVRARLENDEPCGRGALASAAALVELPFAAAVPEAEPELEEVGIGPVVFTAPGPALAPIPKPIALKHSLDSLPPSSLLIHVSRDRLECDLCLTEVGQVRVRA